MDVSVKLFPFMGDKKPTAADVPTKQTRVDCSRFYLLLLLPGRLVVPVSLHRTGVIMLPVTLQPHTNT